MRPRYGLHILPLLSVNPHFTCLPKSNIDSKSTELPQFVLSDHVQNQFNQLNCLVVQFDQHIYIYIYIYKSLHSSETLHGSRSVVVPHLPTTNLLPQLHRCGKLKSCAVFVTFCGVSTVFKALLNLVTVNF